MTRSISEVEQETIIIRSRDKKNILEISTSDIRAMKKVLKYYESNITKKIYNDAYKGVFKDGLVEIFLEIDCRKFKGSVFFPRYRGD